jgi:hypothetical protein
MGSSIAKGAVTPTWAVTKNPSALFFGSASRSGSAAGRAAGRPLQPVVRPQSGLASDHISAAMTFLRVAKLGRNIGQPDHSLVNPVTSYKAERRPGSSEIWLAVTKDDGMQVDSIFIDQAKFG